MIPGVAAPAEMKENSVKHNMSLSVRGEGHNGSGREAREAGPAHGVDSDRGTEASLLWISNRL